MNLKELKKITASMECGKASHVIIDGVRYWVCLTPTIEERQRMNRIFQNPKRAIDYE